MINKFISIVTVLLLTVLSASAIIDPALQMQLGNPSGATADTNNHSHFLIVRSIEALDFNDTLGQPNWASWDLTSADSPTNGVARQDSFAADTNLPAGFHQVGANDYSHSGYDRGHLCDSADRNDTTNHNNLTFLMSNMMPQAPDNNQVTWAGLEGYCRGLADAGNELLITCGPSGFSGAKINTNGYVSIPQYTWKIVVVVPLGAGTATNRINATNRVIAIKVPNTNGVLSAWQNYITSVNQIQVDTGLTFFTSLPPTVAATLRAKVDGQTNSPPVIYAFSPTNGTAGTTVTIIGTNFTSVSAVALNGASASYTVTASNLITAVVPANASSGFVSVTTSSGTAVSTNGFTLIGRGGGTVFSGLIAGWDVSGLTNFGPNVLAPTANAANLQIVGLTRGSGVKQTGTGAANGWGGTGFTNLTSAAAIAANQFVTFSLTVSNGYKLSFNSISRFDYYRSPSGAANALVQFQIGNAAFTDITNLTYPTASAGASQSAIDISSLAALQNVAANTNVTFRIVNYGGTSSSGTWYIFNTAGTTTPDLALSGTITQVLPPTPPGIQGITFAAGQISLVLTGAVANSYTITATTNLINPQWVTLLTTNATTMPITFVDTNVFAQRFYRVSNP